MTLMPDADAIADCVLATFDSLPEKRKPRARGEGLREWVPLAGVVLSQGTELLMCSWHLFLLLMLMIRQRRQAVMCLIRSRWNAKFVVLLHAWSNSPEAKSRPQRSSLVERQHRI
ncbi:hypothetical protein NX059_006999 [Plenodomus lindquistii]|nr:hypothetical protein NX059_006999 [Plenodomus lindquistii]